MSEEQKNPESINLDELASAGAAKPAEPESAAGDEEEFPSSGETPQSAAAEPSGPTVEELTRRIAEHQDRYLRLMAEFDNFKRRTAREFDRMVESANEKLMLDLLPVRDNFDRALKAKETNASLQSLHQGMELTFAKLEETIAKNGLAAFGAKGDAFDPALHDALMNTPSPDIPEGHVAEVFELGYRLNGKVIRHARVVVSSGPAQSDTESK